MTQTSDRAGVREITLNAARGLLMGTFDVLPGVSGGTIALIVGIYERLIESIRAGAGVLVALARFNGAKVKQRWREIEWTLVLPLVAGIVVAIVSLARVIEPLLEQYPVQTAALFSGLILGSLAVPLRRISKHTRVSVAVVVLGVVVGFLVTGLPPGNITDPHLLMVFGAAAVALTAMILPGISGAFLLLVMGMYTPTIGALNDLNFAYIGVFIAGGIIGLGAVAKLLSYLLEFHHDMTMSVLLGLMTGSLRALWPWQDDDRGLLAPPMDTTLWIAIALAVVGFAVVSVLIRLGRGRESDDS